MKEIFLCCEFHFEQADTALKREAAAICNALRERGYDVFFTSESSPDSGVEGYLWMVSSRLDRAGALVLISASPQDCADGWVHYEWESFYRDIAVRRMKKLFVTYLQGGKENYPRGIAESPSYVWGDVDGLLGELEKFFAAEA